MNGCVLEPVDAAMRVAVWKEDGEVVPVWDTPATVDALASMSVMVREENACEVASVSGSVRVEICVCVAVVV